jgi:hypothetical protein
MRSAPSLRRRVPRQTPAGARGPRLTLRHFGNALALFTGRLALSLALSLLTRRSRCHWRTHDRHNHPDRRYRRRPQPTALRHRCERVIGRGQLMILKYQTSVRPLDRSALTEVIECAVLLRGAPALDRSASLILEDCLPAGGKRRDYAAFTQVTESDAALGGLQPEGCGQAFWYRTRHCGNNKKDSRGQRRSF